MDEIRKYIDRFFAKKKMNDRYCMYMHEMNAAADEAETNMFSALTSVFDLGYVRGYRAALTEMKKKARETA